MNINPIIYNCNPYTQVKPQKQSQVNFTSNPNSRLLDFAYRDFFVNIEGYGKDMDWARKTKSLADKTVEKIKKTDNADEVLPYIALGIRDANQSSLNAKKKEHSGLIRTCRSGYGTPGNWQGRKVGTAVKGVYDEYRCQLLFTALYPLENPYSDISLTKVKADEYLSNLMMVHGEDDCINNALDRVGKKYKNLHKKFISKPENVTNETLPEINSDIAEIRWILAHSMPWERGSDAISNVFTRALYKSMGIKTSPLKRGRSLDLEAFCTPLEEYKDKFQTNFEQIPSIVE